MRARMWGLAIVVGVLGGAGGCARDAAKVLAGVDTNVYADSLAVVGPTTRTVSRATFGSWDVTIATFTKNGVPCVGCTIDALPLGTTAGAVDYLATPRTASGKGLTDAAGMLTVRWNPALVTGIQQLSFAYNPVGATDVRFKTVTLTVTP
jgi:hypothetical protein